MTLRIDNQHVIVDVRNLGHSCGTPAFIRTAAHARNTFQNTDPLPAVLPYQNWPRSALSSLSDNLFSVLAGSIRGCLKGTVEQPQV